MSISWILSYLTLATAPRANSSTESPFKCYFHRGAYTLAKYLQTSSLKKLDISCNSIGKADCLESEHSIHKTVVALCEAMKKTCHLTSLNIASNELEDVHKQMLLEAAATTNIKLEVWLHILQKLHGAGLHVCKLHGLHNLQHFGTDKWFGN